MAYRIRYEMPGGRTAWEQVQMQCVAAGILFLLLLVGRGIWPEGLARYFVPEEGAPMWAAARILRDGGTFREGMVALCRSVLAGAGYAP